MKLTPKQKQLIKLMQDGYILLIGQRDTDNSTYYLVSKGYHNIYFRSDTFGHLYEKGLIYKENSRPFSWLLTTYAENLDL